MFNEILPTLKMVLDDSWSPDNRLIATLVRALSVRNRTPEFVSFLEAPPALVFVELSNIIMIIYMFALFF